MKFVKIVLLALFLAVVGYVGLSIATNRGLVNAQYLAQINGAVRAIHLPNPQQATTLLQDFQTSSTAASLSSAVEIEPSKPPITQQAFEYVRYNYCQAVVKDYESRYPAE